MRKVKQMMGITQAYEHLLPTIRGTKDVANIFGDQDPLQATNSDSRKQEKQARAQLAATV